MIKLSFNSILACVLSVVLVQTQVAMANPNALQGAKSPEGQTIYIDPSPSSKGKKVYSTFPESQGTGVRQGVIENGRILWNDGKITPISSAPETPSSPKAPTAKTPSATSGEPLAKVVSGANGPGGRNVYFEQGPNSIQNGKPRVWSFDPSGKVIRGTLLDAAQAKIHWDGQAAPKVDPLQPSRLVKTLSWDAKRKASMKNLTERLLKGDRTLLQEINEQNVRDLENNRTSIGGRAGFTQIGIAFFLALGVLAYFELSTNYTNNPNAWTDFTQSLTDPIGWMMLPAFIAATHQIFKYAAALKSWKWFLATSGAMAAGLITTSVLGKMLMDPNLRLCLGFTSYDKNGRFERDEVACDQLKNAWAGEELFLTIVPLIGHAVMAGGIVAAVIWFAKLGLNATQLGEKIKVGAGFLKKTPRSSGLISVATGVGHMVLFFGAFHLSYKVVNFESNIRDFFITEFNPFRNQAGSALPANMDKLNKAFQAELANGFKSSLQVDDHGESCVNAASRFQKKEQAEKSCGGTILIETLAQHKELMSKWRNLQFGKVSQGYHAWNSRSDAFAKIAGVSYTTYRDFLADLSSHRRGTLDLTAPDIQENMRLNANQAEELRGADLDYEGLFKNVMIRDHYDFLIASMACGPDTKPMSKGEGFFSAIKNMIGSEPTPSVMVSNERNEKAYFYPPRLVDASLENICARHPIDASRSGIKILDTLRDYTPKPPLMPDHMALPPTSFYGQVNGERFSNLLDYLIKAVPEELAPAYGESSFESWWKSEVLPDLTKVDQEIEVEYSKFLNTTYKNVLSSQEIRCNKTEGLVSFDGIGKLLGEAGVPSSCPTSANVRLGHGLANSGTEQIALYFNLLLPVLDKTRSGREVFEPLIHEYLRELNFLAQALAEGDVEAAKQSSFIEIAKILSQGLTDIVADEEEGGPHLRFVIQSLNGAVNDVLNETFQFQRPLFGAGIFVR